MCGEKNRAITRETDAERERNNGRKRATAAATHSHTHTRSHIRRIKQKRQIWIELNEIKKQKIRKLNTKDTYVYIASQADSLFGHLICAVRVKQRKSQSKTKQQQKNEIHMYGAHHDLCFGVFCLCVCNICSAIFMLVFFFFIFYIFVSVDRIGRAQQKFLCAIEQWQQQTRQHHY